MRENKGMHATIPLLHLHRKSSIIGPLRCFRGIKDIPDVQTDAGDEENPAEKAMVSHPDARLLSG